ncbi:MAG: DUF5719 family protein [Ilumatobacteraceae bacterium]
MSRRVLAILAVVVIPLALLVVAVRGDVAPATSPTFAALGSPSMPFVPHQGFINSTWFCPGVPSGADGLGGSVTVANPSDAPLTGQLTVFNDVAGTEAVEQHFEVPARDTFRADLPTVQPAGGYLSAMVEITGGGGFVEQQADHPDGNSVSPCSNSTSGNWYFADNYTLFDSKEDLVVTNPFPDEAIIDVSFASNDGDRKPSQLQGVPVAGHSVYVVDEKYLAKDEAVLAVSIVATRGRVVAGRAQQYLGERQGYSMSLGAPAGSAAWWFADGENDGTNFERYSIFNPSDVEASVQPVFLGVTSETFNNDLEPITVAPHQVASLSIADVPDLPLGRHGAQFSSLTGTPIVVERAITRKAGDGFVTTVVRGVEQYFAESGFYRWSMAIGTDLAVENVLVVLNVSFSDATVAVKALGPGGEVDLPGLEAVPVPASGVVTIAIPDQAAALGHPLIVVGTQPIIVERQLPRGPAGTELRGRSGSLALPG